MKKLRWKQVTEKGFTLIELLVVVGILAVLGTFVIIRFTGPEDTARDTKRRSDLKQYQTALEVYAAANNDSYPNTGGTVAVTSQCGVLTVSACPDDPQAGTWLSYQMNSNGSNYVLWTQLEKTNGFFVLCSTGAAGERTTAPTSSTCPAGL